MKKVLFVQHVSEEGPGTIGEFLRERGVPHEVFEVFRDGGRVLCDVDLSGAMGVVVMGGPMGVYEEAKYPFLTVEKFLIRELVRAGIPVLGVCLGAQLLVGALGGRVTKSPVKEIGWYKVNVRKEAGQDLLFRGFDPDIPVFQWHEDTFELPAYGCLLAEASGIHQALRIGDTAWGLQFHVEVTPEMIRSWCEASTPEEVPPALRAEMLERYALISGVYKEQAWRLYEGFLEAMRVSAEK